MTTFFQKRVNGIACFLILATIASGCASYQIPSRAAYHPGKSMEQQNADHYACMAYAKDRTGYDPTGSAVSGGVGGGLGGAAAGAALGAIIGAILGRPAFGAAMGAAGGALGGATAGGASELNKMHDLWTRQYSVCMRSKGYTVE